MDNGKIRCPWAESSLLMQAYHDSEWEESVMMISIFLKC